MSMLFTSFITLIGLTLSVQVCDVTNCVLTGSRGLIIADNTVSTLIILCGEECKANSTSNLNVFSSANNTIVNCEQKDSCIGSTINLGLTPEGFLDSEFNTNAEREAFITCDGETSCKEMTVNAIGNIDVDITAISKSSFEGSTINCGNDINTQCRFKCSNNAEEPCKGVLCSPITNCECTAINGMTQSNNCPTVEPTRNPSLSPVVAPTRNPSLSPVVPPPPTSNPSKSPVPAPPLCTPVCEDEIGLDCVFNGEEGKIYVCGNRFNSCTMNCASDGKCKDSEFISGATNTVANCIGKDSCTNARILTGSDILASDLAKCDNFGIDQVIGQKVSSVLNCGTLTDSNDDSACKDITYIVRGDVTGDVSINVNSESGISNGIFMCDIDDNAGSCNVNCGNEPSSCKDLTYNCLAEDTQCSLLCNNGDDCPVINNFGDSACPDNALECEITGEALQTYVIPNDVGTVTINCNTNKLQCDRIKVYSSATKTIINAFALEAIIEGEIYIGDLPDLVSPDGFELESFSIGTRNLEATLNFTGKNSGKNTKIGIYGNVDASIIAIGEQSFESSEYICQASKCILECKEYVDSCVTSRFICPNDNSLCRCDDKLTIIDPTSTITRPQSTCPSIVNTTAIPIRQIINNNNINNNNMSVLKKQSKWVNIIIVSSALIVLICALLIWNNYYSKNLSKYYNMSNNINNINNNSVQKNDAYNTFSVEMK